MQEKSWTRLLGLAPSVGNTIDIIQHNNEKISKSYNSLAFSSSSLESIWRKILGAREMKISLKRWQHHRVEISWCKSWNFLVQELEILGARVEILGAGEIMDPPSRPSPKRWQQHGVGIFTRRGNLTIMITLWVVWEGIEIFFETIASHGSALLQYTARRIKVEDSK